MLEDQNTFDTYQNCQPKYTAKESVFACLFREPKNALMFYQAIHPEDTAATERDCELMALESVMTAGQNNALGILVRDRLILLMEAQSTYCPNIALLGFMYLAELYQKYAENHTLQLHSYVMEKIPRPELYAVCTGDERSDADVFCLPDLYDEKGDAELTVHIIRKRSTGDILDQYIDFCKVFDKQVALYGRTEKAAREIIRICLERGVLFDFLSAHKEEVISIITTLFSQENT